MTSGTRLRPRLVNLRATRPISGHLGQLLGVLYADVFVSPNMLPSMRGSYLALDALSWLQNDRLTCLNA